MALKSYDEKIRYLANIIMIARADGKLSSKETTALEQIQKKIKARKTELNKAYKMAEEPDCILTPVGNWSDKISNLEDMMYMSAVDGEVDNQEKVLIVEFAKTIQITQNQLNFIFADVKNELKNLSQEIQCPKCKFVVKGNAKFCPECGSAIDQKIVDSTVNVSYEIPESGVSVEFAESTAAGFQDALKLQKLAPFHADCLKGKKKWFIASWPKENILQVVPLVENLKGMRNRKVYIDGKESKWDDIFAFVWCCNERNSAYKPVEYCFGLSEKRFNIWGCKQARMDWTEWADWFSYGVFKTSGLMGKKNKFIFDKKRIRHELETNLYRYKHCPFIQFDLIEAILNEFPDEVLPNSKGSWVYKRDYEESPGALKITEKSSSNGYTYTDEYYSTGVVPKTVSIGLKILEKAFKTCGHRTKEIRQLLEYKE